MFANSLVSSRIKPYPISLALSVHSNNPSLTRFPTARAVNAYTSLIRNSEHSRRSPQQQSVTPYLGLRPDPKPGPSIHPLTLSILLPKPFRKHGLIFPHYGDRQSPDVKVLANLLNGSVDVGIRFQRRVCRRCEGDQGGCEEDDGRDEHLSSYFVTDDVGVGKSAGDFVFDGMSRNAVGPLRVRISPAGASAGVFEGRATRVTLN